MNATKRSLARAGLVVSSVLAVALTGCRTQVIHETRTVYVPAPAEPAPPPQVVVVPPPEQPPVVVIESDDDFYEPLSAYGRWEVVGSYGRCWIPTRVDRGWRPYSNGHWQRTDAGWYWASDEPWGWATYHYGRWDLDVRLGWIWVPQTQWAPAWVSWRQGGGYVGWAPLPPSARFSASGDVYEPALPPRTYVFVEDRRMVEPIRPATVIVNNTTVINKTVNITKVKVVNKTVINEGPRPDVIERESGRKVQAVPVNEFRHREETAAAARERNIPTRERKAGRNDRQRTEKPVVASPANRQDARPAEAVTQPRQPVAVPATPIPPQREAGRPARDERRNEVTRTPATAKPEKAVEPKRDSRPVEKPAVAVQPQPQPEKPKTVREEKKRETAVEKKSAQVPVVFEPKSRIEVKGAAEREARTPVRVGVVPPAGGKKEAAPKAEERANKRLQSPKEQSRAAEKVEMKQKEKENNKPNKKDKDQVTQPSAAPTRPPQ